jgi:hypothetical protein
MLTLLSYYSVLRLVLLIFRGNLQPAPLNYLSERSNMSLFSKTLTTSKQHDVLTQKFSILIISHTKFQISLWVLSNICAASAVMLGTFNYYRCVYSCFGYCPLSDVRKWFCQEIPIIRNIYITLLDTLLYLRPLLYVIYCPLYEVREALPITWGMFENIFEVVHNMKYVQNNTTRLTSK